MIDTALIMAGGSGQRMRSSGVPVAKPLVPTLGVPLLERNLHALLRAHIPRIIVAVPAGIPQVAEFVNGRLTDIGRAADAEVTCFIEETPLGNIGCAGAFRDQAGALLVVYADNLTTLDLSTFACEHIDRGADMTIATHRQPFRIPFGEVRTENGEVRAYAEKPTYHYEVCSAVSVLGTAALKSLPPDRPTGISTLVQSLISCGKRVHAVPHASPWIDVNDAASIPLAEALIVEHQREFDLWAHANETCGLWCDIHGEYVRLCPTWPAGQRRGLPPCQGDVEFDVVMDDLDETTKRLQRYGVVYRQLDRSTDEHGAGWMSIPSALADDGVSTIAKRALAFALLGGRQHD